MIGMETTQYPPPRPRNRVNKILIIFVVAAVIIFFMVMITTAGILLPTLRARVALLNVQGTIYDTRALVRELHEYRDNPSVRAIVVRIDSPGGSAPATQELYRELEKVRSDSLKPVVVSMGSVAASGGYYISCGADEIFANPATITGSIGVIMNFANWQKLIKKVGIRFEVIKSAEHKDIGSPNRPMTDEEKELLQEVIDDVYDQFIEAVYEARQQELWMAYRNIHEGDNPTSASVRQYLHQLADGRIFSGRQALEYGLVDRLGNLQDAIMFAGRLSGIKGKPRVYQIKKRTGFFDILQGKVRQTLEGIAPENPTLEYRFDPR